MPCTSSPEVASTGRGLAGWWSCCTSMSLWCRRCGCFSRRRLTCPAAQAARATCSWSATSLMSRTRFWWCSRRGCGSWSSAARCSSWRGAGGRRPHRNVGCWRPSWQRVRSAWQCRRWATSDPEGRLPPDGTVVAVPAFQRQALEDGVRSWIARGPLNEEDFFRGAAPESECLRISTLRRPAGGRGAGQGAVLGHAGGQRRRPGLRHVPLPRRRRQPHRNQLNPNHLGGDVLSFAWSRHAQRGRGRERLPVPQAARTPTSGRSLSPGQRRERRQRRHVVDGRQRFTQFVDIPPIGTGERSSRHERRRAARCPTSARRSRPIPRSRSDRRASDAVEPRNTPTIFGAAFNFDNFWDGRARFTTSTAAACSVPPTRRSTSSSTRAPDARRIARGRDQRAHPARARSRRTPRSPSSRSASSSRAWRRWPTGPALSDFEMSFAGRNWAKIGKKLLQRQAGHAARQPAGRDQRQRARALLQPGRIGRRTGPADRRRQAGAHARTTDLIELAFEPRALAPRLGTSNGSPAPRNRRTRSNVHGWTACRLRPVRRLRARPSPTARPSRPNTNQFTQMEANFSLFFGLSVQAYEQLLIPDDTPFDRFMDANPTRPTASASRASRARPAAGRSIHGPGRDARRFPDDPGRRSAPDELFGFDIFAGANLTAALPRGAADPQEIPQRGRLEPVPAHRPVHALPPRPGADRPHHQRQRTA